MEHIIRIFLFIIIASPVAEAQILTGKIINQAGDPIQYATVYIQELKQGTTSNTKGDYEIRLPAGRYTVIYQSLGFEPVSDIIVISENTIKKDIPSHFQKWPAPNTLLENLSQLPRLLARPSPVKPSESQPPPARGR